MNPPPRAATFAARHRLDLAWALLATLTVASAHAARLGAVPAAAVLALALAKAQIVADHFMGLRRVRASWRVAMSVYLSCVGGIVAYAFLSR